MDGYQMVRDWCVRRGVTITMETAEDLAHTIDLYLEAARNAPPTMNGADLALLQGPPPPPWEKPRMEGGNTWH